MADEDVRELENVYRAGHGVLADELSMIPMDVSSVETMMSTQLGVAEQMFETMDYIVKSCHRLEKENKAWKQERFNMLERYKEVKSELSQKKTTILWLEDEAKQATTKHELLTEELEKVKLQNKSLEQDVKRVTTQNDFHKMLLKRKHAGIIEKADAAPQPAPPKKKKPRSNFLTDKKYKDKPSKPPAEKKESRAPSPTTMIARAVQRLSVYKIEPPESFRDWAQQRADFAGYYYYETGHKGQSVNLKCLWTPNGLPVEDIRVACARQAMVKVDAATAEMILRKSGHGELFSNTL